MVIGLATVVLAEVALLLTPGRTALSLKAHAEDVIRKCAATRFHPACYDQEIPKLMSVLSMEDAFKVATIVQEEDHSYGYCHVLGHELAAKETAKDPSKWSEVVHRCPQGVCSNGCLHGAAQERFRNSQLSDKQIDAIKPQIEAACEPIGNWNPTGLEKSECFHGLGHLTMYITGANIKKSMEVCNSVAISKSGQDYRSLCYEGVFMQLFQPLEPEDIALVKGIAPKQKEDLHAFCEKYQDPTKIEACWQEGWPMFRNEIVTPQGTEDFCSKSSSPYALSHCYDMLFYVRAQGTNYDSKQLTEFCKGIQSDEIRGQCFGDMANATIHGGLIHLSQAIQFCKDVSEFDPLGGCYKLMSQFADYNISVTSGQYIQLCNGLPGSLKEQCLAKNQNTQDATQ